MKSGKRANGEGGITQRKDGTWQGEFVIERDPITGKYKKKTVYGKTKAEVADKIGKIKHELSSGIFISEDKIRFSDWLGKRVKAWRATVLEVERY